MSTNVPQRESYLYDAHFDLVTPDGKISKLEVEGKRKARATVLIHGISPAFVGFQIDRALTTFNLKSTLAQLGLDALTTEVSLNQNAGRAEVAIELQAIDGIGEGMLALLGVGASVGKLFAADDRRKVRDPDYLLRMFGRSDRHGRPLLSLGGMHGGEDVVFEVIDGRTVAYLRLLPGQVHYDETIEGFLPTVAHALKVNLPVRDLVQLHQQRERSGAHLVSDGEMLLVQTEPLHVRTVFGAVVGDLLPSGYRHTAASILQPDTQASGNIYEMHGVSSQEISDIPLEFYTLEPHREHVFFADRDQLQASLDDPKSLFRAFETAPPPPDQAAVFVVKGEQLGNLEPIDWVSRNTRQHEFPGLMQGARQSVMVERYIKKQAAYPFLHAIEEDLITSEGILLSRYFPSPVMKRMFLSDLVHKALKGVYFQHPSHRHGDFFSYEDRGTLIDLAKFAIPTYWVDEGTGKILQYVQRNDKDCGMFVPLDKVQTFLRATFFGVYGSNLLAGDFEQELHHLLSGALEMKRGLSHPLLNPDTPLALVTGGGPGAMEVGNRVAQTLSILSCANIVDFGPARSIVNEQKQNPHVEAKMTYRLETLVERQAEFHLDFPIFLQGGFGTDFEYALEQVRRKVGATPPYPILLFGSSDYWREKITSAFQCNLKSGTIKGSEWVGNTFFCVQSGAQGLQIYRDFAEGKLSIGSEGPIVEQGFIS